MNTEVLSIVVGQLMPVIVELINSRISKNKKKAKYLVALVVSMILGLLTTYVSGEFNTTELLGSFGLVFASSQTAYRIWFKDSEIDVKINKK